MANEVCWEPSREHQIKAQKMFGECCHRQFVTNLHSKIHILFSLMAGSSGCFSCSLSKKFSNVFFNFSLLKYFQILLKRKNIFALQWEFLKISPPPLKIEQDGGGADIIGYHHPFYFTASLSWQRVVCSRTFIEGFLTS